MNISAVNHSNNFNQNNTQSFKGLWRRTSLINDKEPAMCIFKKQETYYYHPFADETDEDIKNVVAKNSKAYIDMKKKQYVVNECKVCSTLSFTKSDFEEYKNAGYTSPITEKLKRVHLASRNLFINNELNGQTPAVNEEYRRNLNENA